MEINIIKARMMRDGFYSKNIEATKITSDWYLWIHHTINDIPDDKYKKNINGKKVI